MKATQAKAEKTEHKTVYDSMTCVICGKKSAPWGVYNHGKVMVCSRFCGAQYVGKRHERNA